MAAKQRNYKLEYAKRKARALIREREAKRGKPLSEKYKARIERGLLKGKTVQQSRGHAPGEAKVRRERREQREENGGLTNAQVQEIFAFGERRNFEVHDSELDGWDYVNAAQASGYSWFKKYRKIWEAARRTYLNELRSGRYASRGMGYLTDLTDRANAADVSWLYYH